MRRLVGGDVGSRRVRPYPRHDTPLVKINTPYNIRNPGETDFSFFFPTKFRPKSAKTLLLFSSVSQVLVPYTLTPSIQTSLVLGDLPVELCGVTLACTRDTLHKTRRRIRRPESLPVVLGYQIEIQHKIKDGRHMAGHTCEQREEGQGAVGSGDES